MNVDDVDDDILRSLAIFFPPPIIASRDCSCRDAETRNSTVSSSSSSLPLSYAASQWLHSVAFDRLDAAELRRRRSLARDQVQQAGVALND